MRNKFDITVETNNQAEGYNYAVGSNKLNSKHSNSFTHELNITFKYALMPVKLRYWYYSSFWLHFYKNM